MRDNIILFACVLSLLITGSTVVEAVSPGDVIINEVRYDDVGTDDLEFIEIYNTTGAAINLAAEKAVIVGLRKGLIDLDNLD